jgi:hypothetical protein
MSVMVLPCEKINILAPIGEDGFEYIPSAAGVKKKGAESAPAWT